MENIFITADEKKTNLFQGNKFRLELQDGWEDDTLYIISGPVDDGVQHNINITVDKEPQLDSLTEYAEWQIKSMEEQLKGCRVLLREQTQLQIGLLAFRAIFSWSPNDNLRIYQEQIYVMVEGMAYTLTTSFTKKTRKTLGPAIERMMLSFTPFLESEE